MFILTKRAKFEAFANPVTETHSLAESEEKSLRLAEAAFFRDLAWRRTHLLAVNGSDESLSWQWDTDGGLLSWEGGYTEYSVTPLYEL
jgi:hypothetical protein